MYCTCDQFSVQDRVYSPFNHTEKHIIDNTSIIKHTLIM